MKRRYLLLFLILIFALGALTGFGIHALIPFRQVQVISASLNIPSAENQAEDDLTTLVPCAMEIARAFRDQDYVTLSSYVHPEKGTTFTPNSTVDLSSNLHLSRQDILDAPSSKTSYVWGTDAATNTPISLTIGDYFAAYVWDQDYSAPGQIGVDTVIVSGNAMENVASVYPEGHFVDFHHPGTENSSDWSSLKLVFEFYNNSWYLVGVIHSSWLS